MVISCFALSSKPDDIRPLYSSMDHENFRCSMKKKLDIISCTKSSFDIMGLTSESTSSANCFEICCRVEYALH